VDLVQRYARQSAVVAAICSGWRCVAGGVVARGVGTLEQF